MRAGQFRIATKSQDMVSNYTSQLQSSRLDGITNRFDANGMKFIQNDLKGIRDEFRVLGLLSSQGCPEFSGSVQKERDIPNFNSNNTSSDRVANSLKRVNGMISPTSSIPHIYIGKGHFKGAVPTSQLLHQQQRPSEHSPSVEREM